MHVALTGATGFLGLRLLRRLLDTYRSVTVLVHAGSGDALHRITRFFVLTGVPEAFVAELPGRLRVVETELERPGLGLSRRVFQELADGLGAIWHSAGSINLEETFPSCAGPTSKEPGTYWSWPPPDARDPWSTT